MLSHLINCSLIDRHSSEEWVEDLVASGLVLGQWEDVGEFEGIGLLVSKAVGQESILASIDESVVVVVHDLEHFWDVGVAVLLSRQDLLEEGEHLCLVDWWIPIAGVVIMEHEELVQEPESSSSNGGEESVSSSQNYVVVTEIVSGGGAISAHLVLRILLFCSFRPGLFGLTIAVPPGEEIICNVTETETTND